MTEEEMRKSIDSIIIALSENKPTTEQQMKDLAVVAAGLLGELFLDIKRIADAMEKRPVFEQVELGMLTIEEAKSIWAAHRA